MMKDDGLSQRNNNAGVSTWAVGTLMQNYFHSNLSEQINTTVIFAPTH